MRSIRFASFVLFVALVVNGQAIAESTWSFKKMVPAWGKKSSPPPGLYNAKSKEPSVWTKMNNGSKKMVSKTKEAVPDWLMPETQSKIRKSSDNAKASAKKVKSEAESAKRSIFAPWAQEPEEKGRPKTVPDFLALPKPE